MKTLIKFMIFPIILVAVYACNDPSETSNSSDEPNANNQNLDKCKGQQTYFSYTLNGARHEISQEIMRESTIYSDALPASRISDYHIVWKDNNTMGDFMILCGGENFKVGAIPFPTDREKQGVSLKLDKDGQGIAYESTSGTLNIAAFNYIAKGRASRETRDFIKGTYSGTFKNVFDFLGDENIYQIEIDFCLCGEVGI